MIHQPSGGAQGMASDIAIQAEEIIKLRARYDRLLASADGLGRVDEVCATCSGES